MRNFLNINCEPVEDLMRQMLGDGPVAAAALYQLQNGGSRTRAALALDAAAQQNINTENALANAGAVELLHNASLIHDDVQDGDALRRGQPAVWQKFGTGIAICAGDLMISAAYACLAQHADCAIALRMVHQAVSTTAWGQAQDIGKKVGTVEDYRTIAAAKTGPLLALPVRLALLNTNRAVDATVIKISSLLAIAYQASDDLSDLSADRARNQLNLCLLLELNGYSIAAAPTVVRNEACQALAEVETLANSLPNNVGRGFCRLADRLNGELTEFAHAA